MPTRTEARRHEGAIPTIHVDGTNGKDTFPHRRGSADSPFKTISAAVAHRAARTDVYPSSQWCRILVKPGTYTEQVVLDPSTHKYTLLEADRIDMVGTFAQVTLEYDDGIPLVISSISAADWATYESGLSAGLYTLADTGISWDGGDITGQTLVAADQLTWIWRSFIQVRGFKIIGSANLGSDSTACAVIGFPADYSSSQYALLQSVFFDHCYFTGSGGTEINLVCKNTDLVQLRNCRAEVVVLDNVRNTDLYDGPAAPVGIGRNSLGDVYVRADNSVAATEGIPFLSAWNGVTGWHDVVCSKLVTSKNSTNAPIAASVQGAAMRIRAEGDIDLNDATALGAAAAPVESVKCAGLVVADTAAVYAERLSATGITSTSTGDFQVYGGTIRGNASFTGVGDIDLFGVDITGTLTAGAGVTINTQGCTAGATAGAGTINGL